MKNIFLSVHITGKSEEHLILGMPSRVSSHAFMILFPYLSIISAPFSLVSSFSTVCGISHYGRNTVSDNAGVIHYATVPSQRERENHSLASNLENFINIDHLGFDSLPNWALRPVTVSRELSLAYRPALG